MVKKKSKKKAKVAAKKDPIRKPRNWDKCVSVAYLRLLGASQEVAANQAGCAERSVATWEKCSWWKKAQDEAADRWLSAGDSACRRAMLSALQDPREAAQMARYWADRRFDEFQPPAQRHAGPDGGAVPVKVEHGFTEEQADWIKRKVFGMEEDDT